MPVTEGQIPEDRIELLLAQSDWLRRLAIGLVRDSDQAEDLVQDTWVAALRRAPRTTGVELRSWLSTVVRNFAFRRGRERELRKWHESEGGREETLSEPDASAARVELQGLLSAALLELDEPLRRALVLRYFDALPTREVASRLGISDDNARQRISRALAKLRSRLDRERGSRAAWIAMLPSSALPTASGAAIPSLWLLMAIKSKWIGAVLLLAVAGLGWRALQPPESSESSRALVPVAEASLAAKDESVAVMPVAGETAENRSAAPAIPTAAFLPGAAFGERTLDVICRAREDHRPLEGLVVRVAGEKWVTLDPSGATNSRSPTTGADGRARLRLHADGPWIITALDPDNAVSRESLEIETFPAGTTREITIEHSTREDRVFFGRVFERDGGEPIAGAQLLLEATKQLVTSTDAEGRFELPFGSWGSRHFGVVAEGHAGAWFGPDDDHASAETAFELPLDRGAELIIQFTGIPGSAWRESSAVLSTAMNHQIRSSKRHLVWRGGDRKWNQDCDDAGRVRFTDLPPWVPLALTWSGKSRGLQAFQPLTLEPGEKRSIEVSIDSGCRIEGWVRKASGEPLAAMTILLLPDGTNRDELMQEGDSRQVVKSAISASDGSFVIERVAPGAWRLGPAVESRQNLGTANAKRVAPLALRLEIADTELLRKVELILPDALYIRGHVFDPEGKEMQGVVVTGVRSGSFLSTQSAKDGGFELGPLAQGRYELQALLPGSAGAPSLPMNVEAGTEGIRLQLRRAGSISGRLRLAQGIGPIDGHVIASRMSEDDGMQTSTTQPDGKFRLGGLLPGTIHLSASTEEGLAGVAQDLVLHEGETLEGVEITLLPAGQLSLRYEGKGTHASVHCSLGDVVVAGDGLPRGKNARFFVPPGKLRLEVQVADGSAPMVREFELEAGASKEFRFTDED
ncbi:MAG TPA: sigma-70 family RNA polymerase sigma factor [Planctomycetota bacterium]|nr:sigma-70 family RNA polymerase sigma factor [Planctomycetota bacterium]